MHVPVASVSGPLYSELSLGNGGVCQCESSQWSAIQDNLQEPHFSVHDGRCHDTNSWSLLEANY